MTAADPALVLDRFPWPAPVRSVQPLEGGHINATWIVEAGPRWVLQRINERVFPDPVAVMRNVAALLAWHARASRSGIVLPRLLATRDGAAWVEDRMRGVWRCWAFEEGTVSRTEVDGPGTAREAGRAFGGFLAAVAGYDGPPLAETIPGFHDTPARLRVLASVAAADPVGRTAGARAELAAVAARAHLADRLTGPLAAGVLPRRVVHNDAKVANVLFDAGDGRARAVLDLDTVMPGTALWDVGDLLRSSASRAAEDADPRDVHAEPALVEAVLAGWLEGAGAAVVPAERERLLLAGRVITLEQAARFLADHLAGDRYYAVREPGHNLRRARTQLALLASFEAQAGDLARLG